MDDQNTPTSSGATGLDSVQLSSPNTIPLPQPPGEPKSEMPPVTPPADPTGGALPPLDSAPPTPESEWPKPKPKSKLPQILSGIAAIILVVGVATAAYFVSNKISGRQAVAPTAPESEPLAAGCTDKKGNSKCGKNEYCDGNRCRKNPDPAPEYSCNATNCPAPDFYCSSPTNCLPTNNKPANNSTVATVTPKSSCPTSCPAGQYCIGGSCREPIPCIAGSVFNPTTVSCESMKSCMENADCGAGEECVNGSCVSGGTTTSGGAAGSTALGAKIAGLNQGGGCQTNSDCGAREACVNGSCVSGGTTTTSGGGTSGGGGGRNNNTSTTSTTTTTTDVVAGACVEVALYAKTCQPAVPGGVTCTAEGYQTTPMTAAQKANLRVGYKVRVAITGSKANLKARFRVLIDDVVETPEWKLGQEYSGEDKKTMWYSDYEIKKPGNYKFEGQVTTQP